MAGAVKWIIECMLLIIFLGVVYTVVDSTLAPIIANATGLEATILPLVPAFIVLGVGLVVIFGALKAAGIGGKGF
jgi:hypothetical protein